MILKTEKNKIWYSESHAVAVVFGDWELQFDEKIPLRTWNASIDCIQIPEISWCPICKRTFLDVDGTSVPTETVIRRVAEAIGEPVDSPHDTHAYLVAGLQPDTHIIDPRVIAKMW